MEQTMNMTIVPENEAEHKFGPVMRVALKAILSDTIEEFSAIHKAAACGVELPQPPARKNGEPTDERNPDAILQELNKIFFETLIRFEKCRREDYIEMQDGTFRKLSDDESIMRTFLEEVAQEIDILQLLENEIDTWGTYNSLKNQCEIKQAAVDLLTDLAKTTMEREEMIKTIQERIAFSNDQFEKQKKLYSDTLQRLKNEWQEGRQLSEMSIKFLKASYKQRASVFAVNCEERTKALLDEAAGLRLRLSTEKRQISETSSWLFSELDTETNRLRYLQGRNDVEDLKRELEELTASLSKMTTDHENLKTEFAHCKEVVLDYRAEIEKKRLEEEHKQKYMVSVLQVQAWWRTMIEIKGIKLKKVRKGKGKGKKKL